MRDRAHIHAAQHRTRTRTPLPLHTILHSRIYSFRGLVWSPNPDKVRGTGTLTTVTPKNQ